MIKLVVDDTDFFDGNNSLVITVKQRQCTNEEEQEVWRSVADILI